MEVLNNHIFIVGYYSLHVSIAVPPEAAIPVKVIGVITFEGLLTYNGVLVEKPYIGTEETEDYLPVSIDATKIIKLASFLGFLISLGVLFFLEVFT